MGHRSATPRHEGRICGRKPKSMPTWSQVLALETSLLAYQRSGRQPCHTSSTARNTANQRVAVRVFGRNWGTKIQASRYIYASKHIMGHPLRNYPANYHLIPNSTHSSKPRQVVQTWCASSTWPESLWVIAYGHVIGHTCKLVQRLLHVLAPSLSPKMILSGALARAGRRRLSPLTAQAETTGIILLPTVYLSTGGACVVIFKIVPST